VNITIEERKNLATYLGLLLIAAIGMYYGNTLTDTYPDLRVWAPVNILVMLVGVPFVLFQTRASLPDFWEKTISTRLRILYPVGIGVFFGLLDVILFKCILHPEPYSELPPFLQPFPYSAFLYLSGAFEVEVFYRMIPITLVMLLGTYYKKGRYLDHFFWVAAILTAVREPVEQFDAGPWLVMAYTLLSAFIMNLLQAIYYRKAGFLASLSLRLGHYFIWHLLLGVYVEFIELS
jgi:hypothetical protein